MLIVESAVISSSAAAATASIVLVIVFLEKGLRFKLIVRSEPIGVKHGRGRIERIFAFLALR